MQKTKSKRQQHKRISFPEPGSSPGALFVNPDSCDTSIVLHIYGKDYYEKFNLNNLRELSNWLGKDDYYYWVDIKGFKDIDTFIELQNTYAINPLVLEDITHGNERPKLEEYPNYVYAISRALKLEELTGNILNEQVSFILKKNILFTLIDSYDINFDLVENRLELGKGNIRVGGPSYMMYAIMDTIVDFYFKVLNSLAEKLDEIEDELLVRPNKSIMYDTQQIKRKIIVIRRVAWPERDKLNDIIRSESDLIAQPTKVFYKDAYDHCVQIIDVIESIKEIAANTIDMYLSIISNRMNEIMKVLTIISSIFIPLTFIAGIYGMNFSRIDPVTQEEMPNNMPELYVENGYIYALACMLIIAILQLFYFWRKGWFR